jgi:hypothetical protein
MALVPVNSPIFYKHKLSLLYHGLTACLAGTNYGLQATKQSCGLF